MLEVRAYKHSAPTHEWAKRGLSAVRVAHRTGGEPKDGPEPVAGRSLTWHLDLHQEKDRRPLAAYIKERKPKDLWSSPECRCFCRLQLVNKAQRSHKWRPRGEAQALQMLRYIRRLHRVQASLGGRSHHEQSASSLAPFDGSTWAWAICKDYDISSCIVAGCSVGLRNKAGELLAKAWRIESTSLALLMALGPCKCSGGHEHGNCLGAHRLWRTAIYTPYLATLIAEALVGS